MYMYICRVEVVTSIGKFVEVVSSMFYVVEVITSIIHFIEVVISMFDFVEVITSINILTSIQHIYNINEKKNKMVR